jgi:sec-independent protein translocase protein TatA
MLLPLAMLSDWHVIVLLFIVVLLFGGKKLPEVARGLGEAMREFKKASRDFQVEPQSTANGQQSLATQPTATPPAQPTEPKHA